MPHGISISAGVNPRQIAPSMARMAHFTGLDVVRTQSRVENVDLVVELDLRGPKRLHDQLLIAAVHQPGVRSISTGE